MILLDVMLPRVSGIDVCRQIRATSRVPIIMVTAKGSEIDAVVGLEVGADDYVAKPFRLRELVARVRAGAAARPRARRRRRSDREDFVEVGDVLVDVSRHEVTVRGELVALPLKEFELLELLHAQRRAGAHARRAHRPDLGTELLRRHQDARRPHQAARGPRSRTTRRIPTRIVTVRGVGYRYERRLAER